MAMKLIDEPYQEYDKWGYTCLSGTVEHVEVNDGWCGGTGRNEHHLEINDSTGSVAMIYVKDIPKLIKAMEEAIASIKEG